MDTLAAHTAQHDPDEGAGSLNSADQNLDEDEQDEAWWVAASRTSYQQSYRRSPTRRVFQLYELTGPDIDDAHHLGQHVDGTWRDYANPSPLPWDDTTAGVEAWTTKYLRMALQETVHECLEWLRIHGRPWLTPHSRHHDDAIRGAVDDLFDTLAELRPSTAAQAPLIAGDLETASSTAARRLTGLRSR